MTLAARAVRLARRVLDAILLAVILVVLGAIVLARVVPYLTGGTTLVVGGPSMTPAIPVGAAIHAIPVDPASLAVDDIVSLKVGPEQAIFTHRITRIVERPDGIWLATKGDANAAPDPSIVPASSVIGKVQASIPFAGYVITLLSLPQGVMFVLGLAGCLLAAVWLLETLELDERAARIRRARIEAARSLRPSAAWTDHTVHVLPADLDAALARASVLARALGEPIAIRPSLASATPAPPAAPLRPTVQQPPDHRGSTLGERIASIQATRARRARFEHGRGRGTGSGIDAVTPTLVRGAIRPMATRSSPGGPARR